MVGWRHFQSVNRHETVNVPRISLSMIGFPWCSLSQRQYSHYHRRHHDSMTTIMAVHPLWFAYINPRPPMSGFLPERFPVVSVAHGAVDYCPWLLPPLMLLSVVTSLDIAARLSAPSCNCKVCKFYDGELSACFTVYCF